MRGGGYAHLDQLWRPGPDLSGGPALGDACAPARPLRRSHLIPSREPLVVGVHQAHGQQRLRPRPRPAHPAALEPVLDDMLVGALSAQPLPMDQPRATTSQ